MFRRGPFALFRGTTARSGAQGFTVIEILVCLVILSIVVICAAGLLLQSKRMSRHAAQFSVAAVLAGELVEQLRLRHKRQQFAATGVASAAQGLAPPPDSSDSGLLLDLRLDDSANSQASGGGDCFESACSTEEMDRFTLQDWRRRVAAVLPGARLLTCRDAAPWDATASHYQWACTTAASGSAPLLVKLSWHSPLTAPDTPWPLLVLPVQ